MGKITNLMGSNPAGLLGTLESQKQQAPGKESTNRLRSFIFSQDQNRKFLLIGVAGALLQFIIFKILYPLPDFISDSYSYIETNLYHMDVNLWPIGYSKYLSLIHHISPSDTFLIFTQYFIQEASLFYFFYSILYLYNLPKKYSNILFIFLFFNPLFLYLANCVLSDAIFLSISITLFTQYLWLLRSPKLSYIITHAILIGIAFTFRYTAIYYPIIGAVVFFLTRQRLLNKLLGSLSPWIFILPFIFYTQQKTKEVTGTAEFSVFGGWQIANNALYMYDHINVDSTKLPSGTLELDRMARQYFQTVPPERRQLEPLPGTFFIKKQNAILKPYMLHRYKIEDAPSQFLAWGKVSPVYKQYGSYLIKNYPLQFTQYYLWLNVKNYFIPHLEKFSNYNLGQDSVMLEAHEWFQLKDSAVGAIPSGEFQNHLFFFYPPLFMMLNVYFAISFLVVLIGPKRKYISRPLLMALTLTAIFLCINFCFSVFATPVVMRYQVFPMILLVCFSLCLTDLLDQQKTAESIKS